MNELNIEESILALMTLHARYAGYRPSRSNLAEASALAWVLGRLRVDYPHEHRTALRMVLVRKELGRP